MNRNVNYDALRVIAALFILIENIPLAANTPLPLAILILSDYALLAGKIGVELLLVLSGYYYTRALMETAPNGIGFLLIKRLCRLLPSMWVVVAIGSFVFDSPPWLSIFTTFYNYESSAVGYYDQYMPLWTLCVIAQFGVLWCLPFAFGWELRSIKYLSLAWIAFAFVAGLALDLYDSVEYMNWNYKSVVTRGAGLCVGALLALSPQLLDRIKSPVKTGVAAWVAAIVFGNAASVYGAPIPFTLVQAAVSLTALSLVLSSNSWNLRFGNQIVVLASYSYALYVVEYPVMSYFMGESGGQWNLDGLAKSVVVMCVAAYFIAECIERPINKVITRYDRSGELKLASKR